MLFDLRGKRKNVVRVVYAGLAILFAGGFLLFGIGSETGVGGLGDLLGFGTGSTSSGSPAYDDQIEEAEQRLAEDPKDERALQDLVQLHYQAGNDELEVDEATGEVTVTTSAEEQYNQAIGAWTDYLEVAKKPASATASIVNQAYAVLLRNADPAAVPTLAKDAVVPAEIVAESNPGANPYFTLAQYAYFAGDEELGDEAAKKAVAEVDESQREQIQKELDAVAKAAAQLREQIEKQAGKGSGEEAFTNPLEQGVGGGSLGGAGGALGGGAAPAPAP